MNSQSRSTVFPKPNDSSTTTTGYRVVSEDTNPYYVRRQEGCKWGSEDALEDLVVFNEGELKTVQGVRSIDDCEAACTTAKTLTCTGDPDTTQTVQGCFSYGYDEDSNTCSLYQPSVDRCSGTSVYLRDA